jgi:hypothetical protein
VKVGSINEKHVKRALARLSEPAKEPQGDFPDVVNLEYWFYPHVRSSLVSLLRRIERIREDSTRDILRLAFSASVKEVSLADPRLSVPVRLRRDQYPSGHWLHQKTNARLARLRHIDVNKVFLQKASGIVSRLSNCALHRTARLRGIDVDARKLSIAGDSEADLVLTSPPYLGAQKYIRASSLSLTWLGMCSAKNLRDLEDNNIGREHYPKDSYQAPLTTGVHEADQLIARVHQSDPLRAHIAASYLIEMRDSINECARILRRGGHFILVAGASTLRGTRFPTPEYLTEIAESSGFHLRLHLIDKIRSRSLMTKRHPTAGSIDCESILVFRRKD